MLNEQVEIPEYLNEGRLVPLSKNKGNDQALLKDIRPIIVRSHLAKIAEKALLAKMVSTAPHLLHTARYQTGFKEGTSTASNAARLLQLVHPGKSKWRKKYAALIDLQKAYDTVNREKLWNILFGRCRTDEDRVLVRLLMKIYGKSVICIGGQKFQADRGVVQGAVMSPMLFNVYLEEALNTSGKLKEAKQRGDLLAFADDMLLLTNSKAEMEEMIQALEGLNGGWNLRLNKDKSQVLTKDTVPSIAGIPCMKQVKYLGVPIHVDVKQQQDMAVASVKRNLNHLRWKLKEVEVAIKETLLCVLARSILIYIGTPMVAAKLWKEADIDRLETQLYREVNRAPNVICNKAVMNVTRSLRRAWEVMTPLVDRARLQSSSQSKLAFGRQ